MINIKLLRDVTFRGLLLFACMVLMLAGTQKVYANSFLKPMHILIINSYSPLYSWTKGQQSGFISELGFEKNINFHFSSEYLETKIRPLNTLYAQHYADLIALKYKDNPPNVIYLTDDSAFVFYWQHLKKYYPEVPVFSSSAHKVELLKERLPTNIKGVVERKDSYKNLDLIKNLSPKKDKVLVLGDDSNTFRFVRKEVEQQWKDAYPELHLEFFASSKLANIIGKIKKEPDASLLLITLGALKNQTNQTITLEESIREIRASTDALILSAEDNNILDGIQGGYVTSSQEQGRSAAKLVRQWIHGAPLEGILPITRTDNYYHFNEIAMLNYGFDIPNELLNHAIISHPAPTLYERHKSLFLSIIVFCGGLLLFIAFIIVISMGEKLE